MRVGKFKISSISLISKNSENTLFDYTTEHAKLLVSERKTKADHLKQRRRQKFVPTEWEKCIEAVQSKTSRNEQQGDIHMKAVRPPLLQEDSDVAPLFCYEAFCRVEKNRELRVFGSNATFSVYAEYLEAMQQYTLKQ
ncbi:hypothetical protein MTR_3g011670 [Medicago truncatula]|uniref:Uncharacterized protein n=1 Tax=Medicago truncatula TaxID=3880 RepID=A0A072UV58_MEDTR|nr:hypothetical protein MTR_3g011670 [Medicago truncatula]